ncbi:hypothetical protein SAMN05518800_3250 [Variovorax sp. YR752]|uniref:hypothetical protein n=1 Tax=Variovorax sp. YR752 TaxID=1884383 RepID=UPI000BC5E900|nr:hypothetical protein [Variovorax sp. YR752]SOD27685.1 hypothetical protein SAMN05518800_3250 [Variovorax sp. YR752]
MNQSELFSTPQLPPVQQAAPSRAKPIRVTPPDFGAEDFAVQNSYTVRLADYPHEGADAVKVAMQRFRLELDRHLGGDVLRAMRAYQNVTESSQGELVKDEVILATRWAKAYDAARVAGCRDLGDTLEAYFEVRPI